MKRFAVLLMAVMLSAACNGKKQGKGQNTQGAVSGAAAEKASVAGAQGAPVNREMLDRPEARDQNPPGFATGGGTQAPRQGAPPPEPLSSQQDKHNKKGSVSYGTPAGSKPQSKQAPQ